MTSPTYTRRHLLAAGLLSAGATVVGLRGIDAIRDWVTMRIEPFFDVHAFGEDALASTNPEFFPDELARELATKNHGYLTVTWNTAPENRVDVYRNANPVASNLGMRGQVILPRPEYGFPDTFHMVVHRYERTRRYSIEQPFLSDTELLRNIVDKEAPGSGQLWPTDRWYVLSDGGVTYHVRGLEALFHFDKNAVNDYWRQKVLGA
jgi:hypothetical protein